MASYLIGPLIDGTVRVGVGLIGSVVYYTGYGVFWAGKRLIYGRQPTAEDIQAQLLDQQTEILKKLENMGER